MAVIKGKKNINKKVERSLKLCRKEKACDLRISDKCKECENLEICENNRNERNHILVREKETRKINVKNARKQKELYEKPEEACKSYICEPFEFACPLRDECTGKFCLYHKGG